MDICAKKGPWRRKNQGEAYGFRTLLLVYYIYTKER